MKSMNNKLFLAVGRLVAMLSVVYCSVKGVASRVRVWFGRVLEKNKTGSKSWGGVLPVISVAKDLFIVKYDKAKEFVAFLSAKQSWVG